MAPRICIGHQQAGRYTDLFLACSATSAAVRVKSLGHTGIERRRLLALAQRLHQQPFEGAGSIAITFELAWSAP